MSGCHFPVVAKRRFLYSLGRGNVVCMYWSRQKPINPTRHEPRDYCFAEFVLVVEVDISPFEELSESLMRSLLVKDPGTSLS